jgi:hypothetical protein
MFTIKVDPIKVEKDYPEVLKKWLDIIQNSFGKEILEDKLELYYSAGLFVTKKMRVDEDGDRVLRMDFAQRLDWEIGKVRIDLTLKIGNFVITDRMDKKFVPSVISDMIREITKLKMILEGELSSNQFGVADSVPPLEGGFFDEESLRSVFKELAGFSGNSGGGFDLDDILDKISEFGIDSLTGDEMEFLKSQSK